MELLPTGGEIRLREYSLSRTLDELAGRAGMEDIRSYARSSPAVYEKVLAERLASKIDLRDPQPISLGRTDELEAWARDLPCYHPFKKLALYALATGDARIAESYLAGEDTLLLRSDQSGYYLVPALVGSLKVHPEKCEGLYKEHPHPFSVEKVVRCLSTSLDSDAIRSVVESHRWSSSDRPTVIFRYLKPGHFVFCPEGHEVLLELISVSDESMLSLELALMGSTSLGQDFYSDDNMAWLVDGLVKTFYDSISDLNPILDHDLVARFLEQTMSWIRGGPLPAEGGKVVLKEGFSLPMPLFLSSLPVLSSPPRPDSVPENSNALGLLRIAKNPDEGEVCVLLHEARGLRELVRSFQSEEGGRLIATIRPHSRGRIALGSTYLLCSVFLDSARADELLGRDLEREWENDLPAVCAADYLILGAGHIVETMLREARASREWSLGTASPKVTRFLATVSLCTRVGQKPLWGLERIPRDEDRHLTEEAAAEFVSRVGEDALPEHADLIEEVLGRASGFVLGTDFGSVRAASDGRELLPPALLQFIQRKMRGSSVVCPCRCAEDNIRVVGGLLRERPSLVDARYDPCELSSTVSLGVLAGRIVNPDAPGYRETLGDGAALAEMSRMQGSMSHPACVAAEAVTRFLPRRSPEERSSLLSDLSDDLPDLELVLGEGFEETACSSVPSAAVLGTLYPGEHQKRRQRFYLGLFLHYQLVYASRKAFIAAAKRVAALAGPLRLDRTLLLSLETGNGRLLGAMSFLERLERSQGATRALEMLPTAVSSLDFLRVEEVTPREVLRFVSKSSDKIRGYFRDPQFIGRVLVSPELSDEEKVVHLYRGTLSQIDHIRNRISAELKEEKPAQGTMGNLVYITTHLVFIIACVSMVLRGIALIPEGFVEAHMSTTPPRDLGEREASSIPRLGDLLWNGTSPARFLDELNMGGLLLATQDLVAASGESAASAVMGAARGFDELTYDFGSLFGEVQRPVKTSDMELIFKLGLAVVFGSFSISRVGGREGSLSVRVGKAAAMLSFFVVLFVAQTQVRHVFYDTVGTAFSTYHILSSRSSFFPRSVKSSDRQVREGLARLFEHVIDSEEYLRRMLEFFKGGVWEVLQEMVGYESAKEQKLNAEMFGTLRRIVSEKSASASDVAHLTDEIRACTAASLDEGLFFAAFQWQRPTDKEVLNALLRRPFDTLRSILSRARTVIRSAHPDARKTDVGFSDLAFFLHESNKDLYSDFLRSDYGEEWTDEEQSRFLLLVAEKLPDRLGDLSEYKRGELLKLSLLAQLSLLASSTLSEIEEIGGGEGAWKDLVVSSLMCGTTEEASRMISAYPVQGRREDLGPRVDGGGSTFEGRSRAVASVVYSALINKEGKRSNMVRIIRTALFLREAVMDINPACFEGLGI